LPYPEALIVDYEEGSHTRARGIAHHVALFNWDETTKAVSCPLSALQTTGEITDFWSGEAIHPQDGVIVAVLPPHSSKLMTVYSS